MKRSVFETLEFDKILQHIQKYAISSPGSELISDIRTIQELKEVENQLGKVTECRAIIDFDDPFPIYGLSDIRPFLEKIEITGSYISVDNISEIYSNLVVYRRVKEYFAGRTEKYPLLSEIIAGVSGYKSLEKEISRCIDFDTLKIKDNATPELARIRKSIASLQQSISKRMDNLMKKFSKSNLLQEDVVTIREGRLVLMVKSEYKNRIKGIVHDQSATGATMFIEPLEILEVNNQVRALTIEEEHEIEKILISLTHMIAGELESIRVTSGNMTLIDFIHAKARFSAEIDGTQPMLNDQDYIELFMARHPLLMTRKEKSINDVIPLDLKIGEAYNTLIITGPNAGGKTVTLKTIGLLSLMVSCGIHIPVSPYSDMCIFKQIFSAIGDEQSIENDLSTFSSHIEKLKYITDNASSRDLIIIDEITSGTDPEEGAALAISILEKLTSRGCITIVSTHLGALKVFAHETDRVENGSMEFDSETLEPTYRFRLNIPGSSYAFEIAQRYGMSSDIIRRSRELVGIEKNRMENMLVDLDKKITSYQNRLNEMSIKQTELDALIKFNQDRKEELQKNEKKFKQQALKESEEIVSNAAATIERTIKEIREQQASRDSIKNAQNIMKDQKQRIRAIKKALTSVEADDVRTPLKEVSRGMNVKWIPFNKKGVVLSDVDSAKKVLIETDGIRVKVPIAELQKSDASKRTKSTVNVKVDRKQEYSIEIDLRGMTAEEAIASTDKFIEDAILGGLHQVYIIHGKGTGVLRKEVNKFLEKHMHVKSKRLADWNQGGTGVTIVEIK